MTSIIIPASITEAKRELNSLEALLTAKEWQRAAIVAAFVRPQQGRRTDTSERSFGSPLCIEDFVDLGIKGLASAPTVRRYLQAWLEVKKTHPKPASKVTLPNLPWPPEEKSLGSRTSADPDRAVEQVIEKHGIEAIVKAVAKPEIAAAVARRRRRSSSPPTTSPTTTNSTRPRIVS
jgi:hypothetical protein